MAKMKCPHCGKEITATRMAQIMGQAGGEAVKKKYGDTYFSDIANKRWGDSRLRVQKS